MKAAIRALEKDFKKASMWLNDNWKHLTSDGIKEENKKIKEFHDAIAILEAAEKEVGDDILRDNCFKALNCLYIAAEKSIADDVNIKVKAYIDTLLRQRRTVSREQVEGWAVDMGDSIGVGRIEIILKNILAELGYSVGEPKRKGRSHESRRKIYSHERICCAEKKDNGRMEGQVPRRNNGN